MSLVDSPMKEAHKKAIALAKSSGAIISFDSNIRFPLWNDKRALKTAIEEFLPMADIVKVSDEEIEFITGTADIKKGCIYRNRNQYGRAKGSPRNVGWRK